MQRLVAAVLLAALAMPLPALAQTDLALAKSHTGDFVSGTNGTYSLTTTNVGTLATVGATTVVDSLPSGLSFVSGSGAGWVFSASGQVVTCTRVATIAAGDSSAFTLTVLVQPAAIPSVTNVARVSTSGDSNAANDRATDPTTVTFVDVTVDKSHPGAFTAGSNGSYTLDVTNLGTAATVGNITVLDSLPTGLSFVSGTGSGWSCSASGGVVTCNHPSALGSGMGSAVTLTVAVGHAAVPSVVNPAVVSTLGDVDPANNSDADTTAVTGLPDLAINKSHTGNFVVTTNEDYQILVENVGSASTFGVITMVDTLPNGLTFVSATGVDWSCSASGQIVTCTRTVPLAVADTTTIVLTVNVGTGALPSVSNTAEVSTAGDPNPGNNRDSDPTTVTSGPDLTINKSHQGKFTVGIDGVYTLTVTNIGSASTGGTITVTDVLPSELTFVSATGPGWTCNELLGVVTCTHPGPILPGGSRAITLTVGVTPAAAPSVTNIADVATPGDVDPDNDVDADPTEVTPANLEMAKSHSGSFFVGQNGTYALTVRNVGVGPTSGTITVADSLPGGLSFVSGSGVGWSVGASGSIVTATSATPIAAGDSSVISLTVSVDSTAAPSVTNSATASGGNDGTPGNNTASDPTTVLGPDVTVSKSHAGNFSVGTNGTYDLSVTNAGTASTFNIITVTDSLPPGLTFVSGSGAGWSFAASGQVVTATHAGPFAPAAGGSLTLTVAVAASAFPGVTNRACATTAGDTDPSNDCDLDSTTVQGTDLTLSKAHAGNFPVGGSGTYDLTVTNLSSVSTTGVTTVTDTLPNGLTFVSASGSGWNFSVTGQVVTATHAGVIGPATSEAFSITVSVGPAAVPSVTNRACVATAGDGNPANDCAQDPTTVDPLPQPDLSLSKSHSGAFQEGSNGDYTITVTNVGSSSTPGAITVTDSLPTGLTFISGSGAGWSFSSSGQVVTATSPGPISPGGSSPFTLTVAVGAAAVPSVVNTACVATSADANSGNDCDSDPTAVNPAPTPDLTLTKSHTGSFVAGSTGTYSFDVENLGTAATTGNITVTDSLPNGLTFVSGSGAGWSFGATGQVVTAVRTASLAAGGMSAFTVTVSADSNAVPGVVNTACVATAGDANAGNDCSSDPTDVDGLPGPDVALAKSHSGTFAVGSNGTYDLTVRNLGSAATAGAITVTDSLPAGLTFVSGSGAGWSFSSSGQVVTALHPGSLVVGDSASFTLTVAASAQAVPSVTNTACAAVAGDTDPGNDCAQDPTAVAGPDLSVALSHAGAFQVGAQGTYDVTVTNVGAVASTGTITVTDSLPAGLTFSQASGAGWSFSSSGQAVTAFHAGSLGPAAATAFTLTVDVSAAAVPSVVNVALVSTPGDGNAANDRATDPTAVSPAPAPDLALSKSHGGRFAVGSSGSWDITVTNVGAASTTGGITVVDSLPAGVAFVSGSGPGWSFSGSGGVVSAFHAGPIAPASGAGFTLTVSVAAAALPSVVNTACVATPGDAEPANDCATDPTDVDPAPVPDLAVSKTHTQEFEVGGQGDYLITVQNVGSAATTGVITVTDSLPAGLTFVSGQGPGWSFAVAGQEVTAVHPASLAPGAITSFTLTVAVGSEAAPVVTNRVSVSTPGDPVDGTDEDITTIGDDLLLTKTASRSTAEAGDQLDYTLEITNTGQDPVTDVVVDDLLPAGFSYVEGTAAVDGQPSADPAPEGTGLRFPVGSLDPGETKTLRYRALIGPSAPLGDGVNRAEALSLANGESSNPAQSRVRVRGGVFDDSGVVFGKVFLDRDCWDGRTQGKEEIGIPGVRILLEDGTSAVTDADGMYHFEGVSPRTHVVRVDRGTLPAGALLVETDHRNAGDPSSRFVDLQRGEMHEASFAEGSRAPAVLEEVIARRQRPGPAVAASLPGDPPRLVALGLVEGRIDWRSLASGSLVPARAGDGFAEELREAVVTGADGKARASARGAMYLKGKIRGDYLLRLQADTERSRDGRLFRDIRPDEFYPVYGDASARDHDAQSAGRLYVRVDRGASYLLYGDYDTSTRSDARSLAAYRRSLTGAAYHLDSGPVRLDAFGSEGLSHQVVEEMPGRGVSGPYALSQPDGIVNSEKVEVLTRDRDQPDRVLERVRMQRFRDYELEPFTGRMLFRAPVPSVDRELNPVSIRVTYEVEQAVSHPTYGADGEVQLGPLSLGGSAVRDEDPLEDRRLAGARAALDVSGRTRLLLEVAHSDSARSLDGNARRAELLHESDRLSARAFAVKTDPGFSNPSTPWTPGRVEMGLDGTARLGAVSRIALELLRTEDDVTGGRRSGLHASAGRSFGRAVDVEVGYRRASETGLPADARTAGVTPNELDTVRGRLAAGIFSGEYERDIDDADRYRASVGADWSYRDLGAIYARHEWIRSFAGPFALHSGRELRTAVVGLKALPTDAGEAFSEYRLRGAIDGRESEAAVGLRNRWMLGSGLRADASFERVTPISGPGPEEATAVTAALSATGDPVSRSSLRAEFRTQPSGDDWLASLGHVRRLGRDLALLGRGTWSDLGSVNRTHARARVGLAYRQTDASRWNALTRYEYRVDRDGAADTDHRAHVVAGDLHHAPGRRLDVSFHVAGKLARDSGRGLETDARAWWLASRWTWSLTEAWDAGVMGSGHFSEGARRRGGLGAEIGRTFRPNLRVASGYNVFGFRDDDLTGREHTDHGAYLHVRFKFGEDLFGLGENGSQGTGAAAPVPERLQAVDASRGTVAITPYGKRLSDESVAEDVATFDAWDARIAALGAMEPPPSLYHRTKSEAWLALARDEYGKNDRSTAATAALRRAAALTEALESGADLDRSTDVAVESVQVGAEHWALAEHMKTDPAFVCVEAEVARLELELVRAGHETVEGFPCWSEEHLRAAETLADSIRAKAERCHQRPELVPRPAPPPTVLALPEFVHFAFDSASLSRESEAVLDTVAAALHQFPEVTIRLEGHTDRRGSDDYNVDLSQRRVAAVRRYLAATGVAAGRMNTVHYGESRPRVDRFDLISYARNRRVVVIYYSPSKSLEIRPVPREDDLQVEESRGPPDGR